MKTITRRWLLMAVIVSLVVGITVPAIACFDVHQEYTNSTGQTAYDLHKFLYGNWNITEVYHDKFSNHSVEHISQNITIIKWDDGLVLDNESTCACFSTASGDSPRVLVALWTDEMGNPIGPAGPVTGTSVSRDANHDIIVDVTNSWAEWTGDAVGDPYGQISGTEVYYAFTEQRIPLPELNKSLWELGSPIIWNPLSGFTLNYEQTESYNLGQPKGRGFLLFRFDATGMVDTQELTTVELIQYDFSKITIPSLTNYGLVVLLVLLILSAIIVIRQRRRAAMQR